MVIESVHSSMCALTLTQPHMSIFTRPLTCVAAFLAVYTFVDLIASVCVCVSVCTHSDVPLWVWLHVISLSSWIYLLYMFTAPSTIIGDLRAH